MSFINSAKPNLNIARSIDDNAVLFSQMFSKTSLKLGFTKFKPVVITSLPTHKIPVSETPSRHVRPTARRRRQNFNITELKIFAIQYCHRVFKRKLINYKLFTWQNFSTNNRCLGPSTIVAHTNFQVPTLRLLLSRVIVGQSIKVFVLTNPCVQKTKPHQMLRNMKASHLKNKNRKKPWRFWFLSERPL